MKQKKINNLDEFNQEVQLCLELCEQENPDIEFLVDTVCSLRCYSAKEFAQGENTPAVMARYYLLNSMDRMVEVLYARQRIRRFGVS